MFLVVPFVCWAEKELFLHGVTIQIVGPRKVHLFEVTW